MGSFRDLKIWQKAMNLSIEIYRLTAKFPKEEKYGLSDQVRRSSNSVAANIAEAFGRFHFADKCRVLYQARGECYETRSHLYLASQLNFVDIADFERIDKEYDGLSAGINSYAASLKDDKT